MKYGIIYWAIVGFGVLGIVSVVLGLLAAAASQGMTHHPLQVIGGVIGAVGIPAVVLGGVAWFVRWVYRDPDKREQKGDEK